MFVCSTSAFSQKNILDKEIELNTGTTTIGELLKHISEKYEINISYSSKQIPQDKKIEIINQRMKLNELMEYVFRNTNVSYSTSGNHIILKHSEENSSKKSNSSGEYTISGYVKDASNGEMLIGASVYIKENLKGTVTNIYGFYSITLPAGTYTLAMSYIGYNDITIPIDLNKDLRIDKEMSLQSEELEDVVVTGERINSNVTNTKMGVVKLSSKTINQIPVLMGEADVIKAIKLLPGVQPTGETSSGMSVRGGSHDQNLILLDEATVYNASHLLGFFSVFNNDAIKNIEFMKGNIPARYGGRLSSVLDVRMNDGNMKKFSGNGGVGLIASRLTLESPIVKDKASILISGRRTYYDLFTRLSKKEDIKETVLFFYDLNAKVNAIINDNNRLYVSGYFGKDVFFGMDQRLSWGNHTQTIRWNHLFSQKLFSNTSVFYSNYNYSITDNRNMVIDDRDVPVNFKWTAGMKDFSIKTDLGYFLNTNNKLKFGIQSTFHEYNSGKIKVEFDTINLGTKIADLYALDHGIFLENEQKIGDKIILVYGLRYSLFQNMGRTSFYSLNNEYKVSDTLKYKKREIYNSYGGIEPRVGMTVIMNDRHSFKASYNRSRQYVQLASNSTGGIPLDIWVPASPNIKPQLCDQFSVGYFRNFSNDKYETSIETYYKYMQNQIDFKDHASLLLNNQIEKEFRFGWGQSYGIEVSAKKNTGRFTGWVSYTLSRSERKIKDLNDNKMFLSPYDRPHNVSIVGNYTIAKRLSFSANWVFLSGNAFTSPSGKFRYGNVIIPVYSERNGDRMPNYHRLDLGITLKNKEVAGRNWKSSWNLSVYNAYYKKNPTVVFFENSSENPNITKAKMMYVMPIVPTLTYNFSF